MSSLNMNYEPMGLANNNKLPSWMKCEIKYSLIHIYGTPTIETAGLENLCIRIYSNSSMILLQYDLHIKNTRRKPLISDQMKRLFKPILNDFGDENNNSFEKSNQSERIKN